MAKRPSKKDSDYLRFRPYRAFSKPPEEKEEGDSSLRYWRTIVLLIALAVIAWAAKQLSQL